MSLSTSLRMKIWYDDADGTPVDITAHVLTLGDLNVVGMNENVRPFGVGMDQFLPTGIGHMDPIDIGGLLKTVTVGSLDDLFADRLPEDPDTETRTLTIDLIGASARTRSVETYLLEYKTQHNKDSGLTKVAVKLQPTGEVTEIIPT